MFSMMMNIRLEWAFWPSERLQRGSGGLLTHRVEESGLVFCVLCFVGHKVSGANKCWSVESVVAAAKSSRLL